jgi:hypothetical protein
MSGQPRNRTVYITWDKWNDLSRTLMPLEPLKPKINVIAPIFTDERRIGSSLVQ